jgi:hypothetical protein
MDAFNRCIEKGGKVDVIVIDPKTKERRRICKLKGWGPIAEGNVYEKSKKKK